jgi:membrane protease YdiL (CAAX protease family)
MALLLRLILVWRLTNQSPPVLNVTQILPTWVMIPAWITGSFTEEVLFRSYSVERLTQIVGRRWQAGLITMVAFTPLHLLSWDWIHVLTAVLPGSIMLTLLYLWRQSLAFVVIVHAIILAPLLLLPLFAPYL